MKLKSTVVSAMLAASMAAPAIANETVAAPLPEFTMQEAQALFEQDIKPMQLAALSAQEMKETEGAFWLNLAFGGAIGLGTYAYNNWGNMTWGGALGSTALGAIGGYGVGVAGLRILGPYANTGGFGVALGRPGILNASRWYGNANQFGRVDFHRSTHSSFVHAHRGGWLQ